MCACVHVCEGVCEGGYVYVCVYVKGEVCVCEVGYVCVYVFVCNQVMCTCIR